MSEAITVLLALEARDKATQILEQLVGKLKSVETSVKAAAAASSRSTADIEAANMRAAAATASYERAVRAQAVAQKDLQAALELSKEATTAGAAATKIAAEQEEAALVKLQQAERLVATRSKEMAAAQEAASTKSKAGAAILTGVGIAGVTAAVGVAMIGEKSIKAAADFQTGAVKLETTAGEIHSNMAMVSAGMLQMAGDIGTTTENIEAGAYRVESAGFHGANALNVLRAAGEASRAEGAQMDTVTRALTSALNAYGDTAGKTAVPMTNEIIAAVGRGDMTMENFAGSLSAVLPIAASMGLKFEQVAGAIATMTAQGMTADQASQNLGHTLQKLQSPTQSMTNYMWSLGINSQDLASHIGERGLTGTLKILSDAIIKHMGPDGQVVVNAMNQSKSATDDANKMLASMPPNLQKVAKEFLNGTINVGQWRQIIKDLPTSQAGAATQFASLVEKSQGFNNMLKAGQPAVKSYAAALYAATGDQTAMSTILKLSGDHAGVFADNVTAVGAAGKKSGKDIAGWSDITGTLNFKMDALKGTLEGAKIALGNGLLPAVTSFVSQVTKLVTPIATWMTTHQKLSGIIVGSIGALGGLVAVGVVLAKTIEMVKTAMVALRIATIAEDGALAANPIGIVIGLLVLLAGVIYEAYKHSATFRKIVQETWNGIKTAAEYVWKNVLKPAFEGIKVAIMDGVVPAALWLWHNALEPAFRAIGAVAVWLWNSVLKPAFDAWVGFARTMAQVYLWLWRNAIEPAIKGIAAVAVWLWHNVISPVWDGIKVAISVAWGIIKVIWDLIKGEIKILGDIFHWLWKDIIEPVWQGIQLAISIAWAVIQVIWGLIQIQIKILADVFTWLWRNVLEPVWHGISDVISWAWNNIIKPSWDAFKLELHILGDILSWFYNNVVSPVWHAIGDAISFVWRDVIKPVFDFFASIIKDQVQPAFKAGVDAIGAIWHGLIDVAKAPVRFVVNTVLNDGLLAGYNKLASLFGVKPDNVHIPLPQGFAGGGPIPGVPSRTDNMLAMVATGEHIMPTERTQKWLPVLESIRLHDKLPGFADGGLVGLLAGPAHWVTSNFGGGVGQLVGTFGNTPFMQALSGMGHRFLDLLIHKAEDMVKHFFSSGGGSSGGGGGGQVDQWIAAAIAATGVPASWAGPLHTLVMRESGGSPTAVNNWDINAQLGHPSMGIAQTIGPTFEAYRLPSLPDDIFNPIANLAAAIRYILATYGTIFSVQQAVGATPRGYAAGGLVGFTNVAVHDRGGPVYPGWNAIFNGTGGMEYTGDPRATGGGGTVIVDLRESKFFNQRDIDRFVDEVVDKRIARVLLPGAGVQVRR